MTKKLKLSVCNITNLAKADEEFYLDMMIKSALEFADEIICVLDYNKVNNIQISKTNQFIKSHKDKKITFLKLNFKENFQEARQLAHNTAIGDYLFWLDADEVIHEELAKKFDVLLLQIDKTGIDCGHVQYVHFINDFAHVDNTEPIHYGLFRLYKNYKDLKWNERIHSLPKYDWKYATVIPQIQIFHLGYLRGMYKIYERFERNYRICSFHLPYYQTSWRDWHYYGDYPTKKINIKLIPKIIKDTFMMEVRE